MRLVLGVLLLGLHVVQGLSAHAVWIVLVQNFDLVWLGNGNVVATRDILWLLGCRCRHFAHHGATLRFSLHQIISAVARGHEAAVVEGVVLLSHGCLDIVWKRVCLGHVLHPSIMLWLLLLAELGLAVVRRRMEVNFRLFVLLGASSDLVENICVQVRCRRH